MARLVRDLKVGESLVIGGMTVTLSQKSGQLARLCFESDEPMDIRHQADRRSAPREGEPGRRSTDRE